MNPDEGVKSLFILPLAAKAKRRAYPRQIDVAGEFSVEAINLHFRLRILEVGGDEHIVYDRDALKRLCRLRYDLFPVLTVGVARIDSDDLAARSIEVCLEPEDRAFVAYETVRSVEIIEQLDDLRVIRREVFVINAVIFLRALPDVDDQVAAILCHLAAEPKLFHVGPLVNEQVFRLIGAYAVIIELLVKVRVGELR